MINLDYIIYGLGALVFILFILIVHLELKLRKLLGGKDAKNLEEAILSMKNGLDSLEKFKEDSLGYYKEIEERISRSIQAVETIRFNPWKGTGVGGNQSFSTAFLDEEGNGVVISSLYSHDRVSVFSKPITKHASEYELSSEEKDILSKAKQKIS